MLIKNHFYRLIKNLPIRYTIDYEVFPNNSLGSYEVSNYVLTYSNASGAYYYTANQQKIHFTKGYIYQAISPSSLYNDYKLPCHLKEDEMDCFEEVDIGISQTIKIFLDKTIDENKIKVCIYFADDKVYVGMTVWTKYGWSSSLVSGNVKDINALIMLAYKKLKEYEAKKVGKSMGLLKRISSFTSTDFTSNAYYTFNQKNYL